VVDSGRCWAGTYTWAPATGGKNREGKGNMFLVSCALQLQFTFWYIFCALALVAALFSGCQPLPPVRPLPAPTPLVLPPFLLLFTAAYIYLTISYARVCLCMSCMLFVFLRCIPFPSCRPRPCLLCLLFFGALGRSAFWLCFLFCFLCLLSVGKPTAHRPSRHAPFRPIFV